MDFSDIRFDPILFVFVIFLNRSNYNLFVLFLENNIQIHCVTLYLNGHLESPKTSKHHS